MKAAQRPAVTEDLISSTPHSRWGAPWLGWLAVVLIVYVLSTGPAVKLSETNLLDMGVLEFVYAPLIWTAENCPPVKDFFEWYLFDVWHWHLFRF